MASSTNNNVPDSLLRTFFQEAIAALEACRIEEDEPLSIEECRHLVLEEQRLCLERVVAEHSNSDGVDLASVQAALSNLSSAMTQASHALTEAARKALARLVLTSECQRVGISSLETTVPKGTNPLQTAPMTRADVLELCALCQAALRLETVPKHLRDPTQPLLEIITEPNKGTSSGPPIQRMENLQRLFLQALGYDAELGLAELARISRDEEEDDVELARVIQQTTQQLLKVFDETHSELLLSDQDEGGVTRVLSVQHSETIVTIGGDTNASNSAPISQSMRGNHPLEMAQKAAALRASLVQKLRAMDDEERTVLLQKAAQTLQAFQQQALQVPAGPQRIAFLTSMDAETQKLLALHRIWQEEEQTNSTK